MQICSYYTDSHLQKFSIPCKFIVFLLNRQMCLSSIFCKNDVEQVFVPKLEDVVTEMHIIGKKVNCMESRL